MTRIDTEGLTKISKNLVTKWILSLGGALKKCCRFSNLFVTNLFKIIKYELKLL